MPEITLADDPFVIVTPNGRYTIADPLELMLELANEKLLDANGAIVGEGEGLARVKDRVMTAAGIPSLNYTGLLHIIRGMTEFADGLQKKIASTPNSSTSTDVSPPAPPASAIT